jgi:hypothetical protein
LEGELGAVIFVGDRKVTVSDDIHTDQQFNVFKVTAVYASTGKCYSVRQRDVNVVEFDGNALVCGAYGTTANGDDTL